MKKKFTRRLIKLLLVFNMSLFIISLSISFTILFRSYNYYHVDYVDVDKYSGITKEEEDKSYNDVVDYLAHNKSLETGKVKYSKDNKDHYIDCNTLSIIVFVTLGVTAFIILLKRRFLKDIRIRNHSIAFWGCILSIIIAALVGIVTLILGFDKIFDIFSFIFSLGNNWEQDIINNEIIRDFPRDFFVDSLTFIEFFIVFISIIIIVRDIIKIKKENKDREPDTETDTEKEPVKQ